MTAMELVISEIVMRATAKVIGPGAHPSRIDRISAPLAEAIEDLVVAQGNSVEKPEVTLENYLTWELWNQILDEVEKEIPIVSRIEVILVTKATRTSRRKFMEGEWKESVKKPAPEKNI